MKLSLAHHQHKLDEINIGVDGSDLDPTTLWKIAMQANDPLARVRIRLTDEARNRILGAQDCLEQMVRRGDRLYGINTGVGHLCEATIAEDKLSDLQRNIILSHCCGVGEHLPRDIILAMWLILLNSVTKGNRGIRLSIVDQIIGLLEKGILACVPSRGSVGASGDLSASAHAALVLLGEGSCTIPISGTFQTMNASETLKREGIAPLKLGPKEGLSLINGTQMSTALAVKAYYQSKRLLQAANLAAAMSMESMRANHGMLDGRLLKSHNHPGTLVCGEKIARWRDCLTEKSTSQKQGYRMQDAYSIRCAPQVHGMVWEEIKDCEQILSREINASTDNPLIFADDGDICHGGNFHAIHPARTGDRLACALTILASISERRTNLAMNNQKSGLPQFLTNNSGLNCGFMMVQTTSAALVSECKALAHPASIDSIPTNCDQEDHVSMAPIAGFKANRIAELARSVIAIELLVATQGIDLLNPTSLSGPLERARRIIREQVPFVERDCVLAEFISSIEKIIDSDVIVREEESWQAINFR